MITRNFKLFLSAGKQIPLMINVSQYDHGEKWVFTLYDDNGQKYTPSTGAIVGIKADKKGIINTGTVNSAGQVEIMETQQMTAAAGKAVFELLIDGDTHGTANFIVLVEPKPGDQADMSTSDLSLLQQAINSIAIAGSGAPAVATIAADMTDEGKIYLYAGSEVGYTAGDWYYYNGASWVDGGKYGGVVDATLTQPGQAADAKKVGDEINDLKSQIGLKPALKSALLGCFRQVLGKDGFEDAYNTLEAILNEVNLVSISAEFTQGDAVIYDDASLDDLKQYLTVTANYDNGTSAEVTAGYTLSGSLDSATSTITVTYEEKTTTFDVDVTLPAFDYLPSRDGKLSEHENIRTYVSNASDFSETVTQSGNLRLQGTNSADTAYYQFVFKDLDETDGSHVHSGRIKATVQLYTLPTTSSSVGIFGCVLKLSNGTNGITFGQAKSSSKANLNYAEGNTRKTAKSGVAVGEIWREFELTYNDGTDGSTAFQKLTMDGETVFESNTLSTWSTTSSCIMVLANPLYFVSSLKVYNK